MSLVIQPEDLYQFFKSVFQKMKFYILCLVFLMISGCGIGRDIRGIREDIGSVRQDMQYVSDNTAGIDRSTERIADSLESMLSLMTLMRDMTEEELELLKNEINRLANAAVSIDDFFESIQELFDKAFQEGIIRRLEDNEGLADDSCGDFGVRCDEESTVESEQPQPH